MLLPELNAPINFAGKDGFYWWFGQVDETKDTKDPKNSNRYKVRIAGHHVQSCSAIDTDDLPWAICMFPVTHPAATGNSNYTPSRIQKGTWVIGFYMDGAHGQQPVILGTLSQVTKSTTNISFSNDVNSDECLAFRRYVPYTNSLLTSSSEIDSTKRPGGTGGGNSSNPISTTAQATGAAGNAGNPAGDSGCVTIADAQCKDVNKKTRSDFEKTLTELFGSISNNGGQIGNELISKTTGGLFDYGRAAQGYIDRVFNISTAYIGNAKYQLYALLKEGCKQIASFLLQIPPPEKPSTTSGTTTKSTTQTKTGVLGSLSRQINDLLGKINCSIADLEKKFLDFITNLLYELLTEVVSTALCNVEAIVSKILSELESFFTSVIDALFGSFQLILDIIASPLNILGSALDFIFDLFGITCSGKTDTCSGENSQQYCWGSSKKKKPGEDDFATLDKIISSIEKEGTTELQTTCDENQALPCPQLTSVSVYSGTPNPDTFSGPDENIPTPPIDTDFDDYFDFGPEDDIIQDDTIDDPIILVDETVVSNPDDTTNNIGGNSSTIISVGNTNQYNYTSISKKPTINYIVSSTVFFNPSFSIVDSGVLYTLTADKTEVSQGETIKFTLRPVNADIPNQTVFNYLLFGFVQLSDFVDGLTFGSMTMKDNVAVKSITISDNISISDRESVLFSISSAGVSQRFTIVNKKAQESTTPTTRPTFREPVFGDPEVDENGKIIFIPIDDAGDSYIFPPYIDIFGEGSGASAYINLDENGRASKVIIQRPGRNYVPNKNPKTRCVIDSFINIRPGLGYTSTPTVLVNGEKDIARAIINDSGYIVNMEVIDRTKVFSSLPSVEIFGGGGSGAIFLPSLSCIDTDSYQKLVSDVAPYGSDEVIDCP